jgi:hypothetical protein
MAGKSLALLAKVLEKKSQSYAVGFSTILENFKEKKTKVVTASRDSIVAIYSSNNFEAI